MRGVTPKNARSHPNACEESPQRLRGVTPTPARSHPENGGMAPHQFFENNYFSEANQLRVLTVHEGHMGHYHHWRTDDSSSSCFSAIVNVGKMRGVTPTDATKFESMGAQGASQQSSSRHARLRYSMKLSRQSISFHLKLCANASAGTKECAESPTPVIEENHTSQVLVDIHSTY